MGPPRGLNVASPGQKSTGAIAASITWPRIGQREEM
jgi:hypothetical protein